MRRAGFSSAAFTVCQPYRMTAPSPEGRVSPPCASRRRSGLRVQPPLRGWRVSGGRGTRWRMSILGARQSRAASPISREQAIVIRRAGGLSVDGGGREQDLRSAVVSVPAGADRPRLTPRNPLPITRRIQRTCIRGDATFGGGGVSRAAKGADCKSAGLRLRRFKSYLPHHPEDEDGRQRTDFDDRRLSSDLGSSGCGCSSMVEQQPSS